MSLKVNDVVRQGDVGLRKVSGLPKKGDIKKVEIAPRDKGNVVLAYGEVTGHMHRLDPKFATLFTNSATGQRFLEVTEDTQILHEEHAAINLDAGVYEVIQQTEYTMFGPRAVAD